MVGEHDIEFRHISFFNGVEGDGGVEGEVDEEGVEVYAGEEVRGVSWDVGEVGLIGGGVAFDCSGRGLVVPVTLGLFGVVGLSAIVKASRAGVAGEAAVVDVTEVPVVLEPVAESIEASGLVVALASEWGRLERGEVAEVSLKSNFLVGSLRLVGDGLGFAFACDDDDGVLVLVLVLPGNEVPPPKPSQSDVCRNANSTMTKPDTDLPSCPLLLLSALSTRLSSVLTSRDCS